MNVEFYILKFKNLNNRIIILFKLVYANFVKKNRGSNQNNEIITLTFRALPNFNLFIIYEKDFFIVIELLLNSIKTKSAYYNFTINIIFFDYRFSFNNEPPFLLNEANSIQFCKTISHFKKQISTITKIKFEFNLFAPLFENFLFLILDFNFFVEHKFEKTNFIINDNIFLRFEKDKRNSFYRLRQ